MRKYLAAAAVISLAPAIALAESEDSLSIQMSGVVEDVCTVAFDETSFESSLPGGDVQSTSFGDDNLSIGFNWLLANTTDPTVPTEENGGIGRARAVDLNVDADFFCNGDYELTIEAANGALVNSDELLNTDDFTNRAAYNVVMTFDDGNSPEVNQRVNGTTTVLAATEGAQHDGVISIQIRTGQNFALDTGDARDPSLALIAGLYQEAITFSFVQDGLSPEIAFVAAPDAVTALGAPG